MLAWLSVWGEVQICIWPSWCHCHSLSLAPVNPDWFCLPGFTSLVTAHPGSPGQSPGGRKTVVVIVVVVIHARLDLVTVVTFSHSYDIKVEQRLPSSFTSEMSGHSVLVIIKIYSRMDMMIHTVCTWWPYEFVLCPSDLMDWVSTNCDVDSSSRAPFGTWNRQTHRHNRSPNPRHSGGRRMWWLLKPNP